MAVDLRSVARAAAEAALGDVAPEKKGLSPWRALAIGAGLVTAGRIATGPGGRFVRELVQGHSSNGSAEDEEPEAEQRRGARSRSRADDEPEAEADDEPEAIADDEPDAKDDDDPPKPTRSPKPKPTTSPKAKPMTSPKPSRREPEADSRPRARRRAGRAD